MENRTVQLWTILHLETWLSQVVFTGLLFAFILRGIQKGQAGQTERSYPFIRAAGRSNAEPQGQTGRLKGLLMEATSCSGLYYPKKGSLSNQEG
ncbi:hypothetical protein EWI07_05635 [Sporolactobacillus sp. THM7-4]|nr:hypothetical protein EWI07_05635 [Sporolactobacillus sp. THM7-4]